MAGILSWILGIMARAAIVTVLFFTIKWIVRNGGSTLRLIFETIGVAARYGCLHLRMKLTRKLKEEETEEEAPGPGVKVEGTVV